MSTNINPSDQTITQYSVLCGSSNNLITNISTGSSGQVLQSGGASANPAFSTATYPSTAGTSGNVLTSDGTNWISSAPSISAVQLATITLTNSQVKNLRATPIQIVPAPGSQKIIVPTYGSSRLNYGGTSAFTAAAGQNIVVYYGPATATASLTILANSSLTQTLNFAYQGPTSAAVAGSSSVKENTALYVYNSSATEISGNPENNNTITCWVLYYIISF